MASLNVLEALLRYLVDGSWEHGPGLSIRSLDNPGWSISLDLARTEFENAEISPIQIQRSDSDWLFIRLERSAFGPHLEIDCGVANLTEAVSCLTEVLGLKL